MKRAMSRARRLRIWQAHAGVCHLCGLPIAQGEPWHVEHKQALTCGGTDDDANLAPAHVDCHAGKTRADKKAGAKLTRIAARHIGANPPPKQRIANRGFAKREREPRIPLPPRRAMWITLSNPRGDD